MFNRRHRAPALIAAAWLCTLAMTGCSATGGADGEHSVREERDIQASAPATFANGVFTSASVAITIVESKVIEPGDVGNETGDTPVFALWYETTNLSDAEAEAPTDPLTAWLTHLRVFQQLDAGTLQELTLALAPDAALMSTQTDPIMPSMTVTNAVAYRLVEAHAAVRIQAVDAALAEVGVMDMPLP